MDSRITRISGVFDSAKHLAWLLADALRIGPPGPPNFINEYFRILGDFQAGLDRAVKELPNLPPDVAAEVRALQQIVNGAASHGGNFDIGEGQRHYATSDLRGIGSRGLAAVARHTMPLRYPEAGLPSAPDKATDNASNALSSAGEIAALCDEFLGRLGNYRTLADLIIRWDEMPTREDSGACFAEYNPQLKSEAEWLCKNGPALADALVEHGVDSTAVKGVLLVLHSVGEAGGGPSAVRAEWENVKFALQLALIQLRKSKPTGNANSAARAEHGLPAEQATPPQEEALDLPAILRAARELEEAIRAYASDNTPNPEWWGVVINRVWHTDRALNPKQLGYGNNRRDEYFFALPILQSGPLARIRGVVDKVACKFGLDGVIGREPLDDVLERAREVAAGADYTVMPLDVRWADELRSSVVDLERARIEADSEKASHKDVTMVAAAPPLCRQEQALKTIVEALARIESTCKLRGRAGLLDLHRSLQRFFCQFLSVAYDLNLVELDNIQPNFPAIDLGDLKKRRCFQITSNKSNEKVQRTLVRYVEKKLNEQYDTITIFVIGERQRAYKSLRVPTVIVFDPGKDILGLPELVKHVKTLETATLERLVEIVGAELHVGD